MQPDDVIQAQIDDLLRTDERLRAAAPLIGQVFALITEPKPPTAKKKTKRPRKAPPRVDAGLGLRVEGDTTTATFHTGDAAALRDAAAALREQAEGEEEDEQAAPGGPAPWLKFCRVKKVPNEYRALFGDKALAVVVVDGWLWASADAETRRAGLVLALRGLEHHVREKDKADMCKRTAPPLQTWPDCVDELSHLVAAFTDDPRLAAVASGAAEALGVTLVDRATALLRSVMNTLLDAHGLPPLSELLGSALHDKVCAAVGLDCGLTGDEGHDVYGTDPEGEEAA